MIKRVREMRTERSERSGGDLKGIEERRGEDMCREEMRAKEGGKD